ncbi:hypothetical protein JTE90_028708 [Oedothorax gibbosus]|uniref:Uncharacterized protein n=1 Tax=Oedothorax gibbosus TaxID=931172 RepID=A0AAV6U4J9_9ARAC|nr:hypothetical protein JTE90_028708 [Oedothorax gibbosus]
MRSLWKLFFDLCKTKLTIRKKIMSRIFILAVIFVSLTAVILMKTALQRYHEVRKYFRLQEYASEVHDISESLKTLEANSLTLENEVQQLRKIAQEALSQFNASSVTAVT